MQNQKGNRPGSPGQRQTQNPMQPNDPSVSNPSQEEEEEEESGTGGRQQDEEEATSIEQNPDRANNQGGSQQSNRGAPGNQGRQGRDT